MKETSELCQYLKKIRIYKGKTLTEVSEISGLTTTVIFNLESKQCNPKLDTLIKYLEALEIDLYDIIKCGLARSYNIKEKQILEVDTTKMVAPKVNGVVWIGGTRKWRTCVRFNKRNIILGYYKDFNEAQQVRLKALSDIAEYKKHGKLPSDTLIRDDSISEDTYEVDNFRKSNIVGVNWDKGRSKWRAKIKVKGKNISLGSYSTIEEAAEARRQGEIKYFGNTIDNIYIKTSNKRNKSGIIGVHWNDSRKVWVSKISFMGKSYTLGEFNNIFEAENIRKLAEQNIVNGNFLKWYNERYFTKADVGKRDELIGSKFKTFTVIDLDRKDEKYRKYWNCKCDNCGKIKSIREDNLRKLIFTCDCKKVKKEKPKRNVMVYNTNVTMISNNNAYSNSKSGIRGVYWDIKMNKWRARISFQRKSYELGAFDNIEDAKKARQDAEDRLYGNFLEWYKEAYNTDI